MTRLAPIATISSLPIHAPRETLLTCHVAASITSKVDIRALEFLGEAKTTTRDHAEPLGAPLHWVDIEHVGGYEALAALLADRRMTMASLCLNTHSRHAVNTGKVSPLNSQALCKVNDSCLASVGGGLLLGNVDEDSADTGGEDDAAASLGSLHDVSNNLGRPESSMEVNIENVTEFILGVVLGRSMFSNTSIRNHNVKASKPLRCSLHNLVNACPISE